MQIARGSTPADWPVGGGELGARIRAFDWSSTSLGPISGWPQSLRGVVDIVVNSPVAMVLMWGPDHVMIYNDGYALIAAGRHPAALGGTVPDIWPEVWDWNRAILDAGFRGEARAYTDNLMVLQRNGAPEDVLFDLYYTPVRDETGDVRGVLCTAIEIIQRVDAERRLKFLLDLSERLRGISDPVEMTTVAAETLGRFLGVSRVGYGEVDEEEKTATVHHDWTEGSIGSLAGQSRLIDSFGTELIDELRSGHSLRIDDVQKDERIRNAGSADAFANIEARASLTVPLVRMGRLNAVLYLHSAEPRAWTDEETSLAEDVAARTWGAVQRGRAEAALRKSAQRLRIAQQAGQVGTFEWDPARDLVMMSDEFRALWGLSGPSTVPVAMLAEFIHPDDRHLVLALKKQVDEGALAYTEYRIRRADTGEPRWIARRGEMVRIENGELRGIGVVYDISERKLLEKQLRQLNENLEAQVEERTRDRDRIWNVSQEVFVVADAEGRWLRTNPAATEVLGWSEAELTGRPGAWIEHPDDREATRHEVEEVAAGHRAFRFENRLRHKNGGYRCLSWTAALADNLIYAVARDVTAEKAQAEALRAAEDALRQAQKMEAIGQLTGGIAHDFNNLLTGIIGSMDLLQRRLAAGRIDDLKRYVDVATTAANRAAALTHRLLAFARRQSLDVRPVDVNGLVASMEDLIRRTTGESITIDFDLKTGLSAARTDANQLENALLNLVINARDAMPEGGSLVIQTASTRLDEATARGYQLPPGDYVVMCVSDTGIGMTPEIAARAFDPFFTTKPLGQGTGLGLSMIYGFVRQSGGHIELASRTGEGTIAKLYLPRHRGPAEPVKAGAEPAQAPRAEHGETVLLVEDDAAVRMLVLEVLEDLGYVALEAVEANTAIPILESDARIDLLISDIGLPGMNGRQLADVARLHRPGLKVLFITGYAESDAARSGVLAPGMALVTKPFSTDLLAERVRALIQES